MIREPVNPDDPQMTAYVLGELSIAESVAFEAKLKESPIASRELAEMSAVMDLLGQGLASEWESKSCEAELEVVASGNSHDRDSSVLQTEETIVRGEFFTPAKKTILAAAATVAMAAIVGGSIVPESASTLSVSSAGQSQIFAMSAASQDNVEPANTVDAGSVSHVPRLLLADEMENLSGLELVSQHDSIDATYLDSSAVVPASHAAPSEEPSGNRKAGISLSRVDSYLPPIATKQDQDVTIESRLDERVIPGAGSQVFVRGFVPMDGSDSYFGNEGKVLAGFKPVSISGNPVMAEEVDLRILSKLGGVQRDLESLVEGMPESDASRAQLMQILNRNREAMSELKREFSN